MRDQVQPTPTTCGQTLVAMLVGVNTDDVCGLIGEGFTYPRDLRKALSHYGFEMEKRSTHKLPDMPADSGTWLLFGQTMRDHRLVGHWMLCCGKRGDGLNGIYCPSCGMWSGIPSSDWSGRFYRVTEGKER